MTVKVKVLVLKERLAKGNKSQSWLSEQLEISESYTSHLVQGKRRPSPSLRNKLQKVFNCSFDDLFEIENLQ
jgi:putative transcriptional regulator